jgi:hypothetical protein
LCEQTLALDPPFLRPITISDDDTDDGMDTALPKMKSVLRQGVMALGRGERRDQSSAAGALGRLHRVMDVTAPSSSESIITESHRLTQPCVDPSRCVPYVMNF